VQLPSEKLVKLFEIVQSPNLQVDREAGVIRGVKVLGRISRNGREYLPEAIVKARGQYDGAVVNFDHPPSHSPTRQTSVADRAGWLENAEVVPDGMKADLHLLKADPRFDKIMEAAERRPELFGLSHAIEAKIHRKNGKTFVEEITRVRSVDLVSDPATTRSLFESIEQEETDMTLTIKGLLESVKEETPGTKFLREVVDAGLLAEDDTVEDEVGEKVLKILEVKAPEKKDPEKKDPKLVPVAVIPDMDAALAKILENQDSLQTQLTEIKGQTNVQRPQGGQKFDQPNGTGKKSENAKEFCEAIIA